MVSLMNRTEEEFQQEYERLFKWRELWTRLANTFRKGPRLQSRQEAIERRASLANNLIGRLMREYDLQKGWRV